MNWAMIEVDHKRLKDNLQVLANPVARALLWTGEAISSSIRELADAIRKTGNE